MHTHAWLPKIPKEFPIVMIYNRSITAQCCNYVINYPLMLHHQDFAKRQLNNQHCFEEIPSAKTALTLQPYSSQNPKTLISHEVPINNM